MILTDFIFITVLSVFLSFFAIFSMNVNAVSVPWRISSVHVDIFGGFWKFISVLLPFLKWIIVSTIIIASIYTLFISIDILIFNNHSIIASSIISVWVYAFFFRKAFFLSRRDNINSTSIYKKLSFAKRLFYYLPQKLSSLCVSISSTICKIEDHARFFIKENYKQELIALMPGIKNRIENDEVWVDQFLILIIEKYGSYQVLKELKKFRETQEVGRGCLMLICDAMTAGRDKRELNVAGSEINSAVNHKHR